MASKNSILSKVNSEFFDEREKERRDRDSNPGYAINVNALSKRAHSTTLPSLRKVEVGLSVLGKIPEPVKVFMTGLFLFLVEIIYKVA